MTRLCFVLLVSLSLSLASTFIPAAIPLTPGSGLPGNGIQLAAETVDCETVYFKLDVPAGLSSGYMIIEARLNSTVGSAMVYVRSNAIPTMVAYEASGNVSTANQLVTIKAICNFASGSYYVAVVGSNAAITQTLVNATVIDRGTPVALNPNGASYVFTDANRYGQNEVYDFYRVTEPRGQAASFKLTVSAIQTVGLPFDVFINTAGQAGDKCNVAAKTCVTDQNDCVIEFNPCQYISDSWFVSIRTGAGVNNTNATYTYTLSAAISHPVVKDVSMGMTYAESVVPGSYNYYRLPVNNSLTEKSIRIDAIVGGAVNVYLDYSRPLGTDCGNFGSSGRCLAYSPHSNPICTIDIPSCTTKIGDYYIVVQGVSSTSSKAPVRYTMEIAEFVAPNITLPLDAQVTSTVQTNTYDQYNVVVPANYPTDAELYITAYVDAFQVESVTLTASSSAQALCSPASASSALSIPTQVPYKTLTEVSKSCTTATGSGKNTCILKFNACELRAGNWYIRVRGAAPQFVPISYTIRASLVVPKTLVFDQSVEATASAGELYTHFKFNVPAATVEQGINIEIDSVSGGGYELFLRQGQLAGCDSCYTYFKPLKLPYDTPVGTFSTAGDIVHIVPFIIPPKGGAYYIAVRGNNGNSGVKFTMTVKYLSKATSTVTINAQTPTISTNVPLESFVAFQTQGAIGNALYFDATLNPQNPQTSTADSSVLIYAYNAYFNWEEYASDWSKLSDPKVFASYSICNLKAKTTTSCSIEIPKCQVGKEVWKFGIWPFRFSDTAISPPIFDITSSVRQTVNTEKPLTLGTPAYISDKSPIGTGEFTAYYYSLDIGTVNPTSNQYLEITIKTSDSITPAYLFLDDTKQAGPAPCEGSKWTCNTVAGASTSCRIAVETCELTSRNWHIGVAVNGTSGSRTDFNVALTANLKSPRALVNMQGEQDTTFPNVLSHYVLAYPKITNPGALLRVQVNTANVNATGTVFLSKGNLAGCTKCYSYTEATCTFQSTGGECIMFVEPCTITEGSWYIGVLTTSGREDISITASLFDVAAVPASVTAPITGDVDVNRYNLYSIALPADNSMSIVFNKVDGIETVKYFLFPLESADPTQFNRDTSVCTAATCSNTTLTNCPALLFPTNKFSTWLLGITSYGSKASYDLSVVLNPIRPLTDGTGLASSLRMGAFEAFSFDVPAGGPAPGSYLEIVISNIDHPSLGVKLRINSGTPVRQKFPNGNGIDLETAAPLITTPGNTTTCAANPLSCTTIIRACSFSSTRWYFDVESLTSPTEKNSTSYTITAFYRTPIPVTVTANTPTFGSNVAQGDGAYRTLAFTIPAGSVNGYTSFRANQTSGIPLSQSIGQSSTATSCALVTGTQFGPCCSTGSVVVMEVRGAPTQNNTLTFDYEVDFETPLAIPLTGLLGPRPVRANQYRHFMVDLSSVPAGTKSWLQINADTFQGSMYVNKLGLAGDPADGNCLGPNPAQPKACTFAGQCSVTLEPCQLAGATTVYVSLKATADSLQANVSAVINTLNSTTVQSGESFSGTLQPSEYREIIWNSPAQIGVLAYLELQTIQPPAVNPDPPGTVTATSSTTALSVTVSWTTPVFQGFSTITGYNVYMSTSPNSFGGSPLKSNVAGPSITLTSPDILPTTTYYFAVETVNAAGKSTTKTNAGSAVTTITLRQPDVPTGLTTQTPTYDADTSVALLWTAPYDGGSTITKYTVTTTRRLPTPGVPSNTDVSGAASISTTITGLQANATYDFTITATNVVGTSASSTKVSATTSAVTASGPASPAPPTFTTIPGIPADEGIRVQFTIDNSKNGGSAYTAFNVSIVLPVGEARTVTVPASAGVNYADFSYSDTVTGIFSGKYIFPNTSYTFTVTATNAKGSNVSAPSSPYTTAVAATHVPKSFMQILGVTYNPGKNFTLTVNAPPATPPERAAWAIGNSPLLGYDLQYSTNSGGSWSAVSSPAVVYPDITTSTPLTFNVTNLPAGNYTFRIRARNSAGVAPLYSAPSSAVVSNGLRRMLGASEYETASTETELPFVDVRSYRRMLAAGDNNLDVTRGFFFNIDNMAGSSQSCQIPNAPRIIDSCVGAFCTYLTTCAATPGAPTLQGGHAYRFMLYNPKSTPVDFGMTLRLQDPSPIPLTLGQVTSAPLNQFGSAGLNLAITKPSGVPVSNSYLHLTLANATVGLTLTLQQGACSGGAAPSCTIKSGRNDCYLQVPACQLATTTYFVKISGGVPNDSPTVLANLVAPTPLTLGTPLTDQYNGTTFPQRLYAVTVPKNTPTDFFDVFISNVVNGSVSIAYTGADVAITCLSPGTTVCSSDSRYKQCRLPVYPCDVNAGVYYILVVAQAEYTQFTINVNTKATIDLSTINSISQGEYLANNEVQQYRFTATNVTKGGTFMIVTTTTNNIDSTSCSYDLRVAVNKEVSALSSSPSNALCDLASHTGTSSTGKQTLLVDTCSYAAGTWYIAVKAGSIPTVLSYVNFQVAVSTYDISLYTLPHRMPVTWSNPGTGYTGLVEYIFRVDSVLSAASRVVLTFTSNAGVGGFDLLVNRNARIGYVTSVADFNTKQCLQNEQYRFKRSPTTTCTAGGACQIIIESCDLMPGDYYVRILPSATVPLSTTGQLVWHQYDADVRSIVVTSGNSASVTGVTSGGNNLQYYQFIFNNTAPNAMLRARLSPAAGSGATSLDLTLYRRDSCTSRVTCTATAGSNCVVSVANAASDSVSGTTSCSGLPLSTSWYFAVSESSFTADTAYTLDVTQEVAVQQLPFGTQICSKVSPWAISEYQLPTSTLTNIATTFMDIAFSGQPTSFLGYSLNTISNRCSSTTPGSRCISTNATYVSISGNPDDSFLLKASLKRPLALPLPLNVGTKLTLSPNSNHFYIDVNAGATSGVLRYSVKGTFASTISIYVNKDSMATTNCGVSPVVCPPTGCPTLTFFCGASNGRYYFNFDYAGGASATVSEFKAWIETRNIVDAVPNAAAVAGTVGDETSIAYRLANVAAGSAVSATITNLLSRSVNFAIRDAKGLPACTSSGISTTCAPGGGSCTVSINPGCNNYGGDLYITVSTADTGAGSCGSATFMFAASVAAPMTTPVTSGIAFAPTAGSYYTLAPTGSANGTVSAGGFTDNFLVIKLANPSKIQTKLTIQRSTGSLTSCSALPTQPQGTPAFTGGFSTIDDSQCLTDLCTYVVNPCDLDGKGLSGPVWFSISGGDSKVTVVATLVPITLVTPVPATLNVNASTVELYAVPGNDEAHLVQMQATSGSVRVRVHRVDSCTNNINPYATVAIDPTDNVVPVFEHNVRVRRGPIEVRPVIIIVQGAVTGEPSGYTISSRTGAGACTRYTPSSFGANAYCQVSAGSSGHDIWTPFSGNNNRNTRAQYLSEYIQSKFLCPDASPTACGQCKNTISDECRRAIHDFACSSTFRSCDASGYLLGLCRTFTCQSVEAACGNTFDQVGLPEFSCTTDAYVTDGTNTQAACTRWEVIPIIPSPIPSPFSSPNSTAPEPSPEPASKKKSNKAAIIGGAVAGAVVVVGGAAGAAVMMKKKGGGGGNRV